MLDIIQALESADPRRGLYLHEDFFSEPTFLPYTRFPARVAACAEHFRAQGVKPGDRVIFPFETAEQVFFSFFGLMEVGAIPLSVKPYILSTPKQPYLEFLARISERYGARNILDVPSLAGLEPGMRRVPLPPVGKELTGGRLRQQEPGELVFVQFSSGSTSFPKGVPITHRNLVANMRMIREHDGRTSGDSGSTWLPLYHDMGLIGLLTCLVAGNDAFITQPLVFLMDPVGWLEFMSRRRVAITVIPNFAIDYALKSLKDQGPEELERLELSALGTIYLGSEPINIANLERFCELLGPRGLRRGAFQPCYGMAEAVLMVACRDHGQGWHVDTAPNGQPAISVGRPLEAFDVRLRTEQGQLCGEREFGEIELRGGSLAESYFEDDRPLRGEQGYYATGDLGFMRGGELFITGRINDRIKVNGQSFFSNDFEQAIERVDFIRPGRTAVIQVKERVVVLAEVNRPAVLERQAESQRRVCQAILETVGVTVAAEDVLFIRYGQLKKTSSGKLMRRAIAEAYEQGRIRIATPATLRRDIWSMKAERVFQLLLLTASKYGQQLVRGVRRARLG